MSNTAKIVLGATLALVVILLAGAVCSGGLMDSWQRPPASEQTEEQPDGDCDEGDKYESVPDPDCNGIWYGTPRPAASPSRKAVTPARTPAPRRSR